MGCDAFDSLSEFYKYLKFQSTHPSWGATLHANYDCVVFMISIHAPIVGCDYTKININYYPCQFQSTHPSWGATDNLEQRLPQFDEFQSTHPSWGATERLKFIQQILKRFQSTHPSWGATAKIAKFLLEFHYF